MFWCRFLVTALVFLILCPSPVIAEPLSYDDLMARPHANATLRNAYGAAPSQFGELWLPATKQPAPVIVLIHGGCWQAAFGLELMDYLASDLSRRGYVVWNIEYRRLGEAGGGYPGSFLDVSHAIDALRGLSQRFPLDLTRVVLVGHSAGGQLALWAAARPRLPQGSAVAAKQPLLIAGVISLAGIDDLQAYRATGPYACGGAATIDALIGAPTRSQDIALADTSPRALLPIGVPQIIVSGSEDEIVPSRFAQNYAAAASASGDHVTMIDSPGAGHFDLIDPTSAAWTEIRSDLMKLVLVRGGSLGASSKPN